MKNFRSKDLMISISSPTYLQGENNLEMMELDETTLSCETTQSCQNPSGEPIPPCPQHSKCENHSEEKTSDACCHDPSRQPDDEDQVCMDLSNVENQFHTHSIQNQIQNELMDLKISLESLKNITH